MFLCQPKTCKNKYNDTNEMIEWSSGDVCIFNVLQAEEEHDVFWSDVLEEFASVASSNSAFFFLLIYLLSPIHTPY